MNRSTIVRLFLAATTPVFAFACSGGSGGAVAPEVSSAASELSTSANVFAAGSETPTISVPATTAPDPTYPACHPHLFARSIDYSNDLNYHVDLFLHRAGDALALFPKEKSGSYTWDYTTVDAAVEVTLTKTAPGLFDVTVALAPVGSSAFQNVVTGTIDRSNALDVKKSFAFKFDTLHSVLPPLATDLSKGELDVNIERVKNADGTDRKRAVTYTLNGFVPVYGDPHGPRSGNVYFLEEPGVGGAMVYDASAVFFCPANPSALAADATTFARWYKDGDTVYGRADSIATGGQFPSGNRWVGLTCRQVSVSATQATPATLDNAYWLMKEENASGATLEGTDVAADDTVAADPVCAGAFGAITSLSNNANDPSVPATIPAGAFPGEF